MHDEFQTLPPTATVGQLREWFAGSASRRLALIAERGRYVVSLTRAEVEGDVPALRRSSGSSGVTDASRRTRRTSLRCVGLVLAA